MGGVDSKLDFRKNAQRLLEERNIPPQEEVFWSSFWHLPEDIDDVFFLVSTKDIKNLRDDASDNFKTLIQKIIWCLNDTVRSANDPTRGQPLPKGSVKAVQNCVRLLIRLLPYVFEAPSVKNDTIEQLSNGLATKAAIGQSDDVAGKNSDSTAGLSSSSSFAGASATAEQQKDKKSEEMGGGSGSATPTRSSLSTASTSVPSISLEEALFWTPHPHPITAVPLYLGDILCHTVFGLLFARGLCVPFTSFPPTNKRASQASSDTTATTTSTLATDSSSGEQQPPINIMPSKYIIWETGVGTSDKSGVSISSEMDLLRLESLKLLLVLASDIMYVPIRELGQRIPRFIERLTTKTDTSLAAPLLASLLNCVTSYSPAGWLPYNYVVFEDIRGSLAMTSLHVLAAFMEYRPITSSSANPSTTSLSDSTEASLDADPETRFPYFSAVSLPFYARPAVKSNIFRYLFSKMDNDANFGSILSQWTLLMTNPLKATSTYLPGSMKSVDFYEELLIVYWCLACDNKRLLIYTLQNTDQLLQLILPIVYFALAHRKKDNYIGLLHLSCFILLLLSGDRAFGVALNRPFKPAGLPAFDIGVPLPSNANYADLLVLSFVRILTNGQAAVHTIADCLLTIICNISSYVKSFSMVTGSRLLSLFYSLSSPRQLLSHETHPQLVSLIVESFNNCIQYQFQGNIHLVYEIIRRPKAFLDLKNMTLEDLNAKLASDKDSESSALPLSGSTADQSQPSSQSSIISPTTGSVSVAGLAIQPTEAWVNAFKEKLQLATISRLLQVLLPQVEKICAEREVSDESEILKFIKEGTLVGLLPVPHAIMVRKYTPNESTAIWFTSYLWATLYLRNNQPLIFSGTRVELFAVKKHA